MNTKKSGGARIGAGRKNKDVATVSITVPKDQLNNVDAKYSNRSEAYTIAMYLLLSKEKNVQECDATKDS